jgi:hypothetical protein
MNSWPFSKELTTRIVSGFGSGIRAPRGAGDT